MPELPDITVYIEALQDRLLNQPLQKIRIASPFILRSFDPPIQTAEGKKVLAAQRHSWQEFVEAINRITGIEHA